MKRTKKKSFSSKYILLILSVLCIGMSIASVKTDITIGPLQTVSGYIFVPIQKGINSIGTFIDARIQRFKDIDEVIAENEDLLEQVDSLTTENTQLQEDKYELERLQELLELKDTYSDYNMVGAQIISGDPGNWFNVFTIDKGSDDGIEKDMNVIADGGLVGIIIEVGKNWANVRTIVDDSSNVSGKVLKTSDTCIISGSLQSMNDKEMITFSDLSDDDDELEVGDEVVTSHISEKYVEGILIGYVSKITEDSNGLTKSGYITPVVDFKHLEEVLVITDLKETGND